MVNSKEIILSVSLGMCNTESLITEIRELINVCKNKIKLEEKFICCFIDLYCLLLSLTIFFLFKGNFITSVAVDSLLCQLWFRYKFVKALSEFIDGFSKIYKCFHWHSNWKYWHQHLSEIRYLFYWECISDSSVEFMLLSVFLL